MKMDKQNECGADQSYQSVRQSAEIEQLMRACRLCPRSCGAERNLGHHGRCGVTDTLRVARASLHMWEEPCISGIEGSGTVFFSGCSLGCVYCQNREIALGHVGIEISIERLSEIFLEQQDRGANNINLVTAGHYVPQVTQALHMAKAAGLTLPIVYNSSGYETVESLRFLEGLVDVYLPDCKYMETELARQYSHAPDYPQVVKAALEEMYRQVGTPVFDDRGIMTHGMIVRHLLLPGHVRNAKAVVKFLYETFGDNIYLSLMNQYTPPKDAHLPDALLARRVMKREYDRLLDYALSLGITHAFWQEGDVADESFIPAFDGEGVLPAK